MKYIYSKLNRRALRIDGNDCYVKTPKNTTERRATKNEDEEVNDILRDAHAVRISKEEYDKL